MRGFEPEDILNDPNNKEITSVDLIDNDGQSFLAYSYAINGQKNGSVIIEFP